MRLQYPLMLDGSQPSREAVAMLQDPDAPRASGEWLLVRHLDRLRVRWYVTSIEQLLDALRAATPADTVAVAMHTAPSQTSGTTQWFEATRVELDARGQFDTTAPGWLVVFAGARFAGMRPPMQPAPTATPPASRGPTRGHRAKPQPANAAPTPAGAEPEMAASAPPPAASFETLLALARVDAPTAIAPGPSASGRLSIGLAPAPSPQADGVMRFESAVSEKQIVIDVMVEAPDFTCAGGWKHLLTVQKSDPFAATITLDLAPVLPDDRRARLATIRVHYSHGGQPAGVAVRTIALGDVTAAEVATIAPPRTATLTIAPTDAAVDLTIRIARRDASESARDLIWTLVDCAWPSVTLPAAPLVHRVGDRDNASSFASKVTSQVNAADGTVTIDNMLCSIGTLIRRAMPAEVLAVLTAVHAAVGASRLPRVLLLTDECHVPWELAYLDSAPDPLRAPYLGAQFAVSRWIHGEDDIPLPPPATLAVNDLAIVLGSYEQSNMTALPHAKDETTALTAEAARWPALFPRVTSVDATADALVDLLNGALRVASGLLAPEMVHFACHGEVLGTGIAKRSVLYLNDGSPLQETLFVSSKLARTSKSFLFMNACQVGVGGEELGQYAGFAGFAIGAGFSGFIGPLWSVNDEVAKRIAVDFYRRCFGTDGAPARPVADVLADMRSQYLSEPDPKKRQATWLAYVHYGHPHFTLTHAH